MKGPYAIPDDVGALNPLQLEMEKQKMQDCRNWENVRPAICTFILQNISESSLKRAKTQHHAEWDDALDNSDPELVYKMLVDSHNFHGKAASTEEIDQTLSKARSFAWMPPESLDSFKLRWDNLMKEFKRVGVPDDMYPVSYTHLTLPTNREV